MQRRDCQSELNRFEAKLPLEEAWTLPASWYTWPEFYAWEQERLFGREWVVAARAEQLAQPGNYVSGTVAGEPYVVVRGEDGQLRAFFNVCRHHAAIVAQGAGCAKELVCPYHAWTYRLDGTLRRAPELGGVKGFDRSRFGLRPLSVEEWGPLVFLSLNPDPEPLRPSLQPLAASLAAAGTDRLRFVTRRRYELQCNWKVFVDNYLDGGYHVAHLHRNLASQLDLSSYSNEVHPRFSIQWCGAGSRKLPEPNTSPPVNQQNRDFAERIGVRALYAWVYPNLMLNRYGPILDTNWVLPLGPDRTEVVFDYYFEETEGPDAEAFIERSLAASDAVQQEDIGICESVQQGLRSRAYGQGRYSVLREAPMHLFHRLLAADLQTPGDGGPRTNPA